MAPTPLKKTASQGPSLIEVVLSVALLVPAGRKLGEHVAQRGLQLGVGRLLDAPPADPGAPGVVLGELHEHVARHPRNDDHRVGVAQHASHAFLDDPAAGLLLAGPPADLEGAALEQTLYQFASEPLQPAQDHHAEATLGPL